MSKNTLPYTQSSPETIQALFSSIAKGYDRANALFSFGLHKGWNRFLINSVGQGKRLLDLCAGTGEIAFGFLKKNPHAKAILLDFCKEMLDVAQKKGASFQNRFEIIQADAQKLPFENTCVDAVTIAYGIRNVKDPIKCFEEVYRVLMAKGQFAILEATRPSSSILRALHKIYLRTLLPLIGKWIAKNGNAYRYLAESVQTFTSADVLEKQLLEAGFSSVVKHKLCGGIATILVAKK